MPLSTAAIVHYNSYYICDNTNTILLRYDLIDKLKCIVNIWGEKLIKFIYFFKLTALIFGRDILYNIHDTIPH